MSRTRCSVKRCCAEPTQGPHGAIQRHEPRLCSAPQRRCAASGAREWNVTHTLSPRHCEHSDFVARAPRNDGASGIATVLQLAPESQTHLRGLAAHHARALLHLSLPLQTGGRRKGRVPAAPAVCCARGAQKRPHNSIQVKPNTRPSLRSGRTAYAVLSREPNSLWPPSPSQKSPAARRLTRLPHPQELDRSNDGQDHTVLPYAFSAARPHEASGSRRAIRPAPDISHTTLPRPPQPGPRFERLANRPSSSGRAAAFYASIPNFGKAEYFCGKGLTGCGVFCPTGPRLGTLSCPGRAAACNAAAQSRTQRRHGTMR
ncbi:hypothetical protein ACVWY3_007987 [Bradyrhizobium sp. USDA 4486]